MAHRSSSAWYPLLATCARDGGDAAYYQRLTTLLQGFAEWEQLANQAAWHGLGPLVHKHLRTLNAEMPRPVQRDLLGLRVQSRHAAQVRTQVLAETLDAFAQRGLSPLVLKGAALEHLVYSEPGLRSMSDIDLLIRPTEWGEAEAALRQAGFHVQPNQMPVLRRDGVAIGVELHHDLSNEYPRTSKARDALTRPLLPFKVGADGPTAYTLGHEEMLWHLCDHMRFHATAFTPHRLIWVADIVSFAERFAAETDWTVVRERFPSVHRTLALLRWMTPLSRTLIEKAQLPNGHAPKDIGEEFDGWPRSPLASQRAKGWPRILRDTFFPSEWWLRLRYNVGSESLWRIRCVTHPLQIIGWAREVSLAKRAR